MTDTHRRSETCAPEEKVETVPQRPGSVPADRSRKRSLSMHEGIAVWCDCCSCKAEPYWVEIAEEMGVDPGSDYEDAYR